MSRHLELIEYRSRITKIFVLSLQMCVHKLVHGRGPQQLI